MGFRSTYRPRIGPFAINTGTQGVNSVTVRLLGVTVRLWDKTGKRGSVSSVDLPGPLSYRPRKERRTAGRSTHPAQADRPGPGANPAPWGLNPRYRSQA